MRKITDLYSPIIPLFILVVLHSCISPFSGFMLCLKKILPEACQNPAAASQRKLEQECFYPTDIAIIDLGAMGIDFSQLCLTRPALHVMLRLTTTLLVWKQLFGMVESWGTED